MFTYVHLKNFKSFGNIYFNLLNKYNIPKKMSIVYGENGIGKSNLVSAFYFLTIVSIHTCLLLPDGGSLSAQHQAQNLA